VLSSKFLCLVMTLRSKCCIYIVSMLSCDLAGVWLWGKLVHSEIVGQILVRTMRQNKRYRTQNLTWKSCIMIFCLHSFDSSYLGEVILLDLLLDMLFTELFQLSMELLFPISFSNFQPNTQPTLVLFSMVDGRLCGQMRRRFQGSRAQIAFSDFLNDVQSLSNKLVLFWMAGYVDRKRSFESSEEPGEDPAICPGRAQIAPDTT
jgi:hypothetical protein